MLIVRATYTRPSLDVAYIQDAEGVNDLWRAFLATYIDAGKVTYPPDRRIPTDDDLQMVITSHWRSAADNIEFLSEEVEHQYKAPHNKYLKEHGITVTYSRELVYDELDVE